MTNKRQPGYYWVLIDGEDEPVVAEWRFSWLFHGHLAGYDDSDVDKVVSRITPEMKYTEADMIEWGQHCRRHNFEQMDLCEWLKQIGERQK